MARQQNRLESLARELAKWETVEAAMLAAGYAPKTARQGRVRHDGAARVAEQSSRRSSAAG